MKNEMAAPATIPSVPSTSTPAPRQATFSDCRMLMSSSISTMKSGTANDRNVV